MKNKRGFTLIELMVAISIIAILAAVGLVVYSTAQGVARDAKRKLDLEEIKKAIYLLSTSTGKISAGPSSSPVNGFFWTGWGANADHATWGMNSSNNNSMGTILVGGRYLESPTHDPKCPSTGTCAGWNDYYIVVTDNSSFTLSARLENTSGIVISCTPQTGYNYCISE